MREGKMEGEERARKRKKRGNDEAKREKLD